MNQNAHPHGSNVLVADEAKVKSIYDRCRDYEGYGWETLLSGL